jgi:16S rRNA (uracil1498-N3)-methyltransferase
MLRVFHPGPWPVAGGEVVLSADESSHLVRVRRARLGEPVVLLDGRGGVGEGTLAAAEARAARIRLDKITRMPAPPSRVLAVGLPKGDLFVEIVRSATELGATALQPLLTAHSEVRLDAGRVAHKLDRWRAAALESCKQSGNPWLPEIHAPLELAQWLKTLPPKDPNTLHLVAALTPNSIPISQLHTRNAKRETANPQLQTENRKLETSGSPLHAPSSAPSTLCPSAPLSLCPFLICIGPEGDFSPAEYQLFAQSGFTPVRLPGHTLRVETACVVALACL